MSEKMSRTKNSPIPIDYRQLIELEKFQEAADILTAALEVRANDDQRRDLAYCLLRLKRPTDAINLVKQLDELKFGDYQILASSYWQLTDWDSMATALKTMLKIEQHANVYHHLAIAEARGRHNHELDEASKQLIRSYLVQALQFDDCKLQTFLWLSDTHDHEDYQSRIRVFRDALQRFPNEPTISHRLAAIYIYRLREYSLALSVLEPILSIDEVLSVTRWYQVEALCGLNKFDEALSQLQLIEFDKAMDKARIQVDILMRKGDIDNWFILAEQHADTGTIVSKIRKHFRKAYVNLRNLELNQAIEDFNIGVDLAFRTQESLENYFYFSLDNDYFEYTEFDVILDVCETLLLYQADKIVPSKSQ